MSKIKFYAIALIAIQLLNTCGKNKGCKDSTAYNYNSSATKEDNSLCNYQLHPNTVIVTCNGENSDYPTYQFSYITEDVVWKKIPGATIDYFVSCPINISAKLTIEPGVVVQFAPNARLYTNSVNGIIEAIGTPDSVITLSGIGNGNWSGIEISGGNSILSYVDIINAGNGNSSWSSTFPRISILNNNNPNHIGLYFNGYDSFTQLNMSNVNITGSKGIGMVVNNKFNKIVSSNVSIENCNVPVAIEYLLYFSFINNFTYSNNLNNYFQLFCGDYTAPITFPKLQFPYYISKGESNIENSFYVQGNSGVTLQPGVTMILDEDVYFYVPVRLTMNGTSTEKITFRNKSLSNTQHWNNIEINQVSSSEMSSFQHVNFIGGGKSLTSSVFDVYGFGYTMPFTNCTFSNSFSNCAILYSGSLSIDFTGTTFGNITNQTCN